MSKYYIPELWEFHIGFEYQIHRGYDDFVEGRRSVIEMGVKFVDKKYCKYGSLIVMSNLLFRDADYIRVKHLDREDIESFGFETLREGRYSSALADMTHLGGNSYYISVDGKLCFRGEIRNKSEFKRILTSIGYEVHSD